MRELVKSLGRFSWAMTVLGAKGVVELMTLRPLEDDRYASALDAVARAASDQLGDGLGALYRTGEEVQRGVFELVPGWSSPAPTSSSRRPSGATTRQSEARRSQGARAVEDAEVAVAKKQPRVAAAGLEEGVEQVLEVLEAAGGTAAIGRLAEETGLSRGQVRRRLGRLIEQGRVQRIGQGLKTRYEVVEK